jgi:hypothetical protein
MPKKRRGSRRARRGESKLGILVASFLMCLVVVVIGSIFLFSANNDVKKIDEETLCYKDDFPTDIIAILIDSTEPLDEKTARNAQVAIENIIKDSPTNTLVNLYAIETGSEKHIKPIANLCKPDDGSKASELTSSPAWIRKIFNEKFDLPLSAHLEGLLKMPPSTSSPIIESLQSAVIESFLTHQNSGQDKIVLISDMIQNTSMYSFYKESLSYDSYFSKVKNSGSGVLDLAGIEIQVLVIPNNIPNGTREDLTRFWGKFLIENNADSNVIIRPLSK